MANSKVVLGSETLIDLTSDTATASTVLRGYTFHDASGESDVGEAGASVSGTNLIIPSGMGTVSGNDLSLV